MLSSLEVGNDAMTRPSSNRVVIRKGGDGSSSRLFGSGAVSHDK